MNRGTRKFAFSCAKESLKESLVRKGKERRKVKRIDAIPLNDDAIIDN